VDAILADTNELQTDWVNGGRLDLILDARASQTSVDDVPTVAEFEARTLAAAAYAPASTALSTAVWTAPPTGFLAATFPATVASTTNITAGTITTVTTLTNLPAITANWLTAAGTAADFGTEVAAAVLAAGDIDGYSLEEAHKLQLAALAGEVSGAATTTVVIRAADDSKARITATVDADGNRSALTLDETG
jgi:hypothetical protein